MAKEESSAVTSCINPSAHTHPDLCTTTCWQLMDAYTHWYTLQVPGWTLFSLQNCLNSSWHRFIKMLETFLRSFGQYWHDSITVTADLLTTRHVWWCKRPITPHPKGALLNELLAVEYNEFTVKLRKLFIILLEAVIKRWVHFERAITTKLHYYQQPDLLIQCHIWA